MGSEKLVMPVQRVEGLVITEAGDDVLIYDQNSYSLHTLNKQSYQVWQHCDGIATVDSVAATTGMNVDVVKRALTQLEDATLLEAPLNESLRSNESRRSFMKKAGIVAIPAIVSVSVPLAKAAASHCTIEVVACGAGTEGKVCDETLSGNCVRCQSFPGFNLIDYDDGVPIYRLCGEGCPEGWGCSTCPNESTTPGQSCCFGTTYRCG